MLALLIKPAAMKSAKNRRTISSLKDQGAVVVNGHDAQSIRTELQELLAKNRKLTFVACGGDGTVNLAVNSCYALPVKFTVIPMGTGNDFARHIGISNQKMGIEVLKSGLTISADLGQIQLADGQTKYFAAVASCGFDAQVNERANHISGPNGPAKYLLSVFAELKELKPLQLNLKYEDRELSEKVTLIALGNTSSYGGGMKITPSADLQDGEFALTIVAPASRRTLVRVLPTVFTGRHVFHRKVSVDRATQVTISGNTFPIYADGERMGLGPAVFKVLPASLQLMIPSGN